MTNLQTQVFPRSNPFFSVEPTEYDRNGEIIYPEQRETDMGETLFHYKLISYFWNALTTFFVEREDVFIAANMNLYYEEGTPQKWYAPDIFVAFGTENYPRSSYRVWQEGIFPQVVFEVASDRTWDKDIGEKYKFYQDFGVEEYYILDPEFMFLSAPMLAYHRWENRLLSVNVENNRVLSPLLSLEIVRLGRDFRLFNPQTNEFLPNLTEAGEKIRKVEAENLAIKQKAEAEIAGLKAEINRLKARK